MYVKRFKNSPVIEGHTCAKQFFCLRAKEVCLHNELPVGFVHSVLCTVFCVLCFVYSVLCIVFCVQCFVYSVLRGPWWFSLYFILEREDTKVKIKSTVKAQYMTLDFMDFTVGFK